METPSGENRGPKRIAGFINKALGGRAASYSTLTLTEYRRLFKGTIPPTNDQISAFASFLSKSHSWYKHLPPSLPGAPFQIYLNPHAGMDRIRTADGGVSYVDRPLDGKRFHYSWTPTSMYRSKYGYLDYFTDRGTQVMLSVSLDTDSGRKSGAVDVDPTWPLVLDEHASTFHLAPTEVKVEGLVHLTSAVHPDANIPLAWKLSWKERDREPKLVWPDEIGGQKAAARALELCAEFERRMLLSMGYDQDARTLKPMELNDQPKPHAPMSRSERDQFLRPILDEFENVMLAMREWHLGEICSAAERVARLVYV